MSVVSQRGAVWFMLSDCGNDMMSAVFWLNEDRFTRLAPHLPIDTRCKHRADDHRVISGIVHVPKSSGRWVDAPAAYGLRMIL